MRTVCRSGECIHLCFAFFLFMYPAAPCIYTLSLHDALPSQKRLRRADDPALPRLAEFAARLGEPALRERLTALADHADPEVRIQAARALGSFPHRESVAALKRLATDDGWAVRAQAVRSLGMIADVSTRPLLKSALRDDVWWVRLRADGQIGRAHV